MRARLLIKSALRKATLNFNNPKVNPSLFAVVVILSFCMITLNLKAQHAGDIFIGRSAANQLKRAGYDISDFVILQPVSGLLNGWSDNDPGFDHVIVSNPPNDLFPLAAGAEVWLEIVAIDPALRILGPGLSPILDAPGEDVFLGDEELHEHLTWHINSNDPDFDAANCLWAATLFLRDDGTTNYADSAAFTLLFAARSPDAEDCNANGLRDSCDLSLGYGNDCNNNAMPDECENLNPCSDFDVCTCDLCTSEGCSSVAVNYGDVTCNGAVPNLDDILCVLGGFTMFSRCPNADLAPLSSGNGVINLDDILAVLGAFGGNNPCQ